MAGDNKPLKYARYAIGEIVLVVIGILIALQINNWNEQNKIKLEEEILIAGLIQNIDEDIKGLKTLKKSDSIFLSANKILLSAFKNDSIRKNKSFLASNIFYSMMATSFNPTQTIFNQMEFSGKLNYVSNDSIKNKIQFYYDNVKDVMDGQEINLKIIFELNMDLNNLLDINSSFQSLIPQFAKMELDEFDNLIFYEPLQSKKVKEFANIITTKQALMSSIYYGHNSLLQNGIEIKRNLIEYLDSK